METRRASLSGRRGERQPRVWHAIIDARAAGGWVRRRPMRALLITGLIASYALWNAVNIGASDSPGTEADSKRTQQAVVGDGVAELRLDQMFRSPVGPRGLEYSDLALELKGKRVRLRGFVVRQARPIPWCILLSPFAQTLHEREYGLCDDLPMHTVHVLLPRNTTPTQPNRPGPQVVIGTLELGPREEADERRSVARLQVSPSDLITMGWVAKP